MIKLLLFARRKPGLTRQAFRDRYEARHVPLAVSELPHLRRYVRNFLAEPSHGNSPEYDVVTEFWFDNEAEMKHDSLASQARGLLARDEAEFFDRGSMQSVFVEECVTVIEAIGHEDKQ